MVKTQQINSEHIQIVQKKVENGKQRNKNQSGQTTNNKMVDQTPSTTIIALHESELNDQLKERNCHIVL
jgi:hypothetical protein